ncbi:SDR family NAD(P)-dependent oxidoreductase [Bordetella genomosp. 5]|uniref:SDR family NAD(P)-dependent oxidoreductase n=1 Tax=Bordetella genomosp. 5 TaxID=1395608 RepID=UPI0015958745|nr:SDR family oxidoreductase [Bordetella genomosp. 5]
MRETPMKVVVTGSKGGVGKHLVEKYLREGATVIGIDRLPRASDHDEAALDRYIECDIASMSAIDEAVGKIQSCVQSIDLLIHAAGVFHDDDTVAVSSSAMEALWRSNYLGPMLLTERLRSLLLLGRDPSVVFIASADAIVASGGQDCEVGVRHDMHYAASKGALVTATRALAMRWARDRIRVNAICPTIIRSPMADSLLAQPGKERELVAHIPLGRICEVSDVAVAVDALHGLTMTTSHVLPLDGGYLCQ